MSLPFKHPSDPHPSPRPATACFHVQARAEPSVLPRVMQQFAKRGLVPARCHSALSGPNDGTLLIDVQMPGIAQDLVDHVAACLRQIVEVDCVLTAEKRFSSGD